MSAHEKICQIQHDEGIGKQWILALLQKRLMLLNRGVQVTGHRRSDQRNQAGMNCMVETKNRRGHTHGRATVLFRQAKKTEKITMAGSGFYMSGNTLKLTLL